MSLLEIATIGHPILRQRAQELDPAELATARWQDFIDSLVATMRNADGAGLAAIQVYEPVRIAVIEVRADNPRYPEKEPIPLTVLVNPVLEPLGDEMFTTWEGCLSVPDLRGKVSRHRRVRVTFLDRQGERHVREVEGFPAVTYQHECDHLDGKLFVDRADPSTFTTWKNYRRHHHVS